MIAIVFPGQGSQVPGMGADLYDSSQAAKDVFAEVTRAIGRDASVLCFETSDEELRRTENAQVALYTAGLAAWKALESETGLKPAAFAGHSVGEYTALAAAGVLSISDGAKLVAERGRIMAAAGAIRPGTMAAVLGLNRADLEAALAEREGEGTVVVANDNCPGQLVISGDVNAVHDCSAFLAGKGAKRVLPLNVSGAFHSPLMEESAQQMAAALAQASFNEAQAPVYSNVTAAPGSGWARLLEDQLRNAVRWSESIVNMRANGVETFIECGAGEVLCGLIRRIDKEATTTKVLDQATLQAAVQLIKA